MTKKVTKVLIGDDSPEIGVRIASHLQEHGIYAITRKKSAAVILEAIEQVQPDIVISDLSLPESDSVVLIQKLKELKQSPPQFIIYSETDNNFIKRQVLENGAAYYFTLPLNISEIEEAVKALASKACQFRSEDIEIAATDILHKLGIPAHIKGYHYLRTAVIKSLSDRSLLDCITKRLYPTVAEKYDTTPSRVERSIRHAIECSWERSNCNDFYSFFGYESLRSAGKPTNSELIALITDTLRLRFK